MSGISVPLQITNPDGGEDGRFDCQWTGGRDFTPFLPNRFCVFQAKATRMGPAKWMEEAYTKDSKKTSTPKLNDAVRAAISKKGAYIGFSKEDLGGVKIEAIKEKILEGIKNTGASGKGIQIDIYDTNKIAEWVRLHPSVALWLIEKVDGTNLVGYLSSDAWSARAQFSSTAYVQEIGNRFSVLSNGTVRETNTLTAQDTAERIFDHLSAPRRSFRLLGHSGLGKTRYVTEIFQSASGTLPNILSSAAVFCDYREVSHTLLDTANTFAKQKTPTVLVVDECPSEIAQQLHEVATHADSMLRVLTINLDDVVIPATGFMCMKALPSGDHLIDAILSQFIKAATPENVAYLRTFCAGFPKIAVILGSNYQPNDLVLTSAAEVVRRILEGADVRGRDAVTALQGLALFDALSAEGRGHEAFDSVANTLCDMTGNRMFEHLMLAARHDLVGERDRKLFVQLDPVADHLAAERLSLLRVATIVGFFREATHETRLSMARRWGHIPHSTTAKKVVTELLGDERFSGWEYIDSTDGSHLIVALADFWPERLARQLLWTITNPDTKISPESYGRRTLVYALTKLVFPQATFMDASAALLTLAAAEKGNDEGVATKAFGQLFQSFLSGTEVPPDGRWVILEDAVQSQDLSKIGVAVLALGRALSTSYLSRTGGTEQLGRRPPLKDWTPPTWGDVWNYQSSVLDFLMRIWREQEGMRPNVQVAVGSNLRNLMIPPMFAKIDEICREVSASVGVWTHAYKKVGDWLYYDSKEADPAFVTQVKTLQKRLFPVDIVDQALLFASFWPADLHAPGQVYKEADVKPDFEYGSRQGREVGDQIAKDQATAERAISELIVLDLPNPGPIVMQIGLGVSDPIRLLRLAVWKCASIESRSARNMVSSLVTALHTRDAEATQEALQTASLASTVPGWTQDLFSSVTANTGWLQQVINEVRAGNILPENAGMLSYGQRLNAFTALELLPLFQALEDTNTADGLWAVLEIVLMYRLSASGADPVLLNVIKPIIVDPKLLSDERQGRNDNHLFETLILATLRDSGPDTDFVRQLAEQLVRLCQSDSKLFHDLDQAVRTAFPALIAKDAATTWDVVARFYERATSIERYMLGKLISSGSGIYDRDLLKPGPLFPVHPLAEAWAQGQPGDRIGFIVTMYPMLEEAPEGWTWTPAFDALSKTFGKYQEFREAVERRIWELTGGFANEYAVGLIAALRQWQSRNELMLWATSLIDTLEAQNGLVPA